jgi:ubiquinone/menaquinone biosynthesis C-methylase UbiE
MGLYSKYIFPRLLECLLGSRLIQKQRRVALAPARGNTLEIGFGTGLSLPHYPDTVTRLTVIDSERVLEELVEKRISQSRVPVEKIHLDASRCLPFDDDSFDSVVTTFTLCTIHDVGAALAEARRVLVPGGRFIFLEHGRSDDPRTARFQDLLNPIQNLISCGCNLNRKIDHLVREAGFEITSLDRFVLPATPRILAEIYRGAARKT